MTKKRYTEEQIHKILAEARQTPIKEVCRKYAVSEASFYKWKQKFGGMELSDIRRLKILEEENRKLKRIVADQAMDIVALKDVLSKEW